MAVLVVVPVLECRHPEANVVLAAEWSFGVVRPVLECVELEARLTRSAAIWESSRSARSQATTLRFQTSITT